MNVLTFLRDIGKHFSVNQMINKRSGEAASEPRDDHQGILHGSSLYNPLQGTTSLVRINCTALPGYDWRFWTSGGTSLPVIDPTRRLHQNHQVFGLTVPLITKADGNEIR
ncbi:hypothetical protein KCP78_05950 [Salmonella enterica subsp. enterica]|nr:hypothetical protein KCP78_05950 [Salmonella enterica subsp. enterica]